mmetsp:Transcript_2769/g.9243  ORF Transcript_2769/g.9243 Transcript_2769/m.9243 type:complete len:199 (+) Transcript_2769:121-717(+)
MAESDNVVRAGLTPKFKDVDVLCEMLTYDDGPPYMVPPLLIDGGAERYIAPVPEFLVDRAMVEAGGAVLLPASPFVSIVVVVEGRGKLEELVRQQPQLGGGANSVDGLVHAVRQGSVFMACAGTALQVRAEERLLIFRATAKHDLAEAEAAGGGGAPSLPTTTAASASASASPAPLASPIGGDRAASNRQHVSFGPKP